MAVFRVEKIKDYTIMSNHHLRNVDLSLKAKGLMSLMLSLPEDWDYTLKGLACICRDGVFRGRSRSWRITVILRVGDFAIRTVVSEILSTPFTNSRKANRLSRNYLNRNHLNGKIPFR